MRERLGVLVPGAVRGVGAEGKRLPTEVRAVAGCEGERMRVWLIDTGTAR